MELTITGKNMEISDRVREYVEKKAGRLDRYLGVIDDASLELTRESAKSAEDRYIAQLTVRARGTILRAGGTDGTAGSRLLPVSKRQHRGTEYHLQAQGW
jgi:ribosomal subunit interface protein